MELQNSPRTICYAICTLVHKHFGVGSSYHCCVADLLCDKSNHQIQADKDRLTNSNLTKQNKAADQSTTTSEHGGTEK